MRSMLFVPGDSEKKLAKALESGADALIVDLEDSVSAENKPAARRLAAEFLRSRAGKDGPLLYVRVNDLGTGLTDDDLVGIMPAGPHGVMLPKCNGANDVARLSVKLRVHEADNGLDDGATRIVPIITETGQGVLAAATYGVDPDPRLTALTWGAEDLAASVGARASRDESGQFTDLFRLARSLALLAASSAEISALDTVFTNFRDEAAFHRACVEAERDGFVGAMAIHPAQVPVINEVYTPAAESVAEAERVVRAFREAGNPGVLALDGKMYDRPHLRQAERLLARAERLVG
jgi:citrate lyase subunit beta/citryl-CoA lyase